MNAQLSAAAAATALKRASSLHKPTATTPTMTHQVDGPDGPQSTDLAAAQAMPPLRRRRSSMSERSFRSQTPEEHARIRRDSLSDGRTIPESARRGSFSIPMTLRSPSHKSSLSKGKKRANVQSL